MHLININKNKIIIFQFRVSSGWSLCRQLRVQSGLSPGQDTIPLQGADKGISTSLLKETGVLSEGKKEEVGVSGQQPVPTMNAFL